MPSTTAEGQALARRGPRFLRLKADEFGRARRSNSTTAASRRRRPPVTTNPETHADAPLLARPAPLIVRRRWVVLGAWIALTLFGAFSAGQVSKRWFESFSI